MKNLELCHAGNRGGHNRELISTHVSLNISLIFCFYLHLRIFRWSCPLVCCPLYVKPRTPRYT